MESFYAALAEGASTGQALESARAFLRSRPETAHPFYWAGYVLIGDGDLHLPLERSRFPLPGWQLALLILAGAVLGVLAARRIVR